jgi:NAD(P)H-hydrate epimerase
VTTQGSEPLREALAAGLLPERDPRGHKGTFGRVVAVAGSLDYAGAALMAGTAALRAGAGLVSLCLPASLQPVLAGRVPELITRGLPERAPFELDAAAAVAEVADLPADALLLGPGLRPGRDTTSLVTGLLALEGPAAIVDAGALEALSRVPRWWTRLGRPAVLTPHAGELARLGRTVADDEEERAAAAREMAAAWGVVLVLKGAHTVVVDPDGRCLVAPFELPALGTAGSGDVLAGIVASFAAQGLGPLEAAALGVFVHGRAGEDVSGHLGDAGLLATDLLPAIPRVRRHLATVRTRAAAGRLGFVAPVRDA